MGFPKIKRIFYDSGSECFKEILEVESVTWCFADLKKDSEYNIILFIQAQGFGSHDDILDVSSSLSGISIKREQLMEFNNMLIWEDRVFSDNFFSEDSLEIFGLGLSSWHFFVYFNLIYLFRINKNYQPK